LIDGDTAITLVSGALEASLISEREGQCTTADEASNAPDTNVIAVSPSIKTVEATSVAKVYLELYFKVFVVENGVEI
jgi:hypothetical protein